MKSVKGYRRAVARSINDPLKQDCRPRAMAARCLDFAEGHRWFTMKGLEWPHTKEKRITLALGLITDAKCCRRFFKPLPN